MNNKMDLFHMFHNFECFIYSSNYDDCFFQVDGKEAYATSFEELVLEFHPVETKRVEPALESWHHVEHASRGAHEQEEAQEETDRVSLLQEGQQDLVNEDLCQLRVGQRQRPKTQVRGGVRYSS